MNDIRLVRRADPTENIAVWKTQLDRLMAAILLLPGLPMILLLMLFVRLTSRGPGIFKQVRTGQNGKLFAMYKLRTMYVDAETELTGPVWAEFNDPRTTSIGRWLRATHLDELPQLFNVLKGEMSLVGPRPERPEFVAILVKHIPQYTTRLHVLPGITGLAQVNLPPDSDLESVQRKLFLDRAYIDTGSFWLDLRLLCCTAAILIGFDGQKAARTLNVKRSVPRYPYGLLVKELPKQLKQSDCENRDVDNRPLNGVPVSDSIPTCRQTTRMTCDHHSPGNKWQFINKPR